MENMYDVVILGSGLGSLECGLILAKEGKKVLILEKNRQIGGVLQIFSRDKKIIDTGVHYIGGLGKDENLNRIFSYFGIMDSLKTEKLDEDCFDLIRFENINKEYKQAQGFERYAEQMSEYFPQEKIGIFKYIQEIQKIALSVPLFNLEKGFYNPLANPYFSINTKDFIANYVKDPILQSVLAGGNLLYDGRPNLTPIYVHAIIMYSYIQSSWRCVGGGSQIAILLAKKLKELGAEIKNYSQVNRLHCEDGKVVYAETESGEIFYGKMFISGIHPVQTFDLLEKGLLRKSFINRIQNLENSNSMFCVHCIMKPSAFPYLKHNIYSFKNTDVWKAGNYQKSEWPISYGLFASSSHINQEYSDVVNVMSCIRTDEFSKWSNTFRTVPKFDDSRGEEYENYKLELSKKITQMVEHKFPDFENAILAKYSSSPLSYRDYIGTSEGAMYGILKDSRSPTSTFMSPRTKIPNLYLTGQNLNLHGIMGVSISSIITCSEILGLDYLIEKIQVH